MHSALRPPFPYRRTLLATALVLAGTAQSAELVDMTGRRVQIPDRVDRIFAATPPIVPLVYAIDPGKLVTLSFPFQPEDAVYVPPAVMKLPIVGRYTGEGPPPNPAILAKAAPQLTIAWDMPFIDATRVEDSFRWLGTPGLFVHLARLADYPAALELVGQAIGAEARATQLANAIREAMTRVEQAVGTIPDGERKRVYFAEGPEGLLTECADSFHAEVIGLAGGENVMDCKTQAMCGREKVTLEQLKTLDPDAILTDDARFLARVKTDPTWGELRAVREGQVHLAPTKSFNWLGRPPSFMRALAIQWFANRLYPERFPWDADLEITSFYGLFLGVTSDVVNVRDILGQG
ncbi:ABC transporter substrate-binding protein [Thiocystis violascens]|uniref:ABC-type Fe3+-hydroxamate transport system, periplasmic component n=1 Tax=Thiocystis violascens (strain ATCC 17096 / DSM 198 / 6111) TaxID=765911 RepID=I3YEA0_THIV6|nr:ABC transporter substrate-binding protein [Thiocystis violascens]AFL75318.1 ABC-type Fe3+-hydroxamate transport system, periplasmic component [Thiocystis violascens DSM 198]